MSLVTKSTRKVAKTIEVEEEVFTLTITREQGEKLTALLGECAGAPISYTEMVKVFGDKYGVFNERKDGTLALVFVGRGR